MAQAATLPMSLALVQHLHLPEHPAADVAQLLLDDLRHREERGTWKSCSDATRGSWQASNGPTWTLHKLDARAWVLSSEGHGWPQDLKLPSCGKKQPALHPNPWPHRTA